MLFQLGAGAELRREQIPHVFLRRDESREEGEARRQVRPSLPLLHRAEWARTQADRHRVHETGGEKLRKIN